MIKKPASLLSLLILFSLPITAANAAMVSTIELLGHQNREQLIGKLEREDVQAQLIAHGVDPQAAVERVKAMTNEEIAQLNGQIDALPAGGNVGTVELLLIIIIIILLL